MSIDKRQQERFSLNLQAKISHGSNDSGQQIDTMAANISPGGAFLTTDADIPMAGKVKIEFHLDIDDVKKLKFILSVEALKQLTGRKVWVTATGIVIRKEKKGVGIIFDTDYQLTPMKLATIGKER